MQTYFKRFHATKSGDTVVLSWTIIHVDSQNYQTLWGSPDPALLHCDLEKLLLVNLNCQEWQWVYFWSSFVVPNRPFRHTKESRGSFNMKSYCDLENFLCLCFFKWLCDSYWREINVDGVMGKMGCQIRWDKRVRNY